MKVLEPGPGLAVNKCFCGCSATLPCGLWGPSPLVLIQGPHEACLFMVGEEVWNLGPGGEGGLEFLPGWLGAHYVEGHCETLHSPGLASLRFTFWAV